MVEMRLRARSNVRIRGERGKFPSSWMSLSVKSIASRGCYWQGSALLATGGKRGRREMAGAGEGENSRRQHPDSQCLEFCDLFKTGKTGSISTLL